MTPRNLQELRDMEPGRPRIDAANAYIAEREEAVKQARRIRDDDIRALVDEHGPAKAARLAGVSVSTIKLIRGRT